MGKQESRREVAERIIALKRPPSKRFSVRFIDHIQGTNCAEWECGACHRRWVSPANLECPHCHNNETDSKMTDADMVYNQAVDDALAILTKESTNA